MCDSMKKKQSENKKSQSHIPANGASLLILLMLGFILLYIFLIPPEAREELLNITSDENDTNGDNGYSEILLSKSPGELFNPSQNIIDHPIPDIYLFEESRGIDLFSIDHFYIERGAFSDEKRNLTFSYSNPENIKEAYLGFNVINCKGILSISFNNNLLTAREFSQGSIEPIKIESYLFDTKNTLTFELSKPKFLGKNSCELANLRVVSNILNPSYLSSQSSFTINNDEYENTRRVRLYFVPTCTQSGVGKVSIQINNKAVYDSTPVCNNMNAVELNKDLLLEGSNSITFALSNGKVAINQIYIQTELKESINPVYYFQVNNEQMEALKSKRAILKVEFADDFNDYDFVANLNGIKIDIESDGREYSYVVTNFLREGSNYLKIIPKSERLNIADIRIYIE